MRKPDAQAEARSKAWRRGVRLSGQVQATSQELDELRHALDEATGVGFGILPEWNEAIDAIEAARASVDAAGEAIRRLTLLRLKELGEDGR